MNGAEAFFSGSSQIGSAFLPDFAAARQYRAMSSRARRFHSARNPYFGIVATSAALVFVIAIVVGLI
jgi:hypothetical protein